MVSPTPRMQSIVARKGSRVAPRDSREDLQLATSLGFFLLTVRGLAGGVELEVTPQGGRLIRYDPEIAPALRAQLVCRAIRSAQVQSEAAAA